MSEKNWSPYTWHCSNCGNPVTGYRNNRGTIKVECRKCHCTMVRTIKGKKHDTIEMYAPQ